MRATVAFAFAFAAFAAVLAAPSGPKAPLQIAPIAFHAKALAAATPQDLVGDLIQIIGQFYGVNPAAIRYEAEDVLNAVQTEIPAAINRIITAAQNIDDQLAASYTILLTNAVAEAERISAPLVEVIQKILAVLPARSSDAGINNLVDDLLVLVVGLTRAQLEDLVNQTLTALVALGDRTVTNAQDIAAGVSAEFAATVASAVATADAKIRREIEELLEELKPLLPRDASVQVTLEELLIQLENSLAGCLTAIAEANAKLEAGMEGSLVYLEVNAVINSANVRVNDIINYVLLHSIGKPVEVVIHMIQLAQIEIQEITRSSWEEIQRIVRMDGAELLIIVQDIAFELFARLEAELQPLLDLIGQIEVPSTAAPQLL